MGGFEEKEKQAAILEEVGALVRDMRRFTTQIEILLMRLSGERDPDRYAGILIRNNPL